MSVKHHNIQKFYYLSWLIDVIWSWHHTDYGSSEQFRLGQKLTNKEGKPDREVLVLLNVFWWASERERRIFFIYIFVIQNTHMGNL